MITTGRSRWPLVTCSKTSSPLTLAICRSVSTRSMPPSSKNLRPASPESAWSRRYPSGRRTRSNSRRIFSSSSTIRIVASAMRLLLLPPLPIRRLGHTRGRHPLSDPHACPKAAPRPRRPPRPQGRLQGRLSRNGAGFGRFVLGNPHHSIDGAPEPVYVLFHVLRHLARDGLGLV